MAKDPAEQAVRIALLEAKLVAADEARGLQAREYERRLTELNHAHARAMEERGTFASRELHDSFEREMRLALVTLEERFTQRVNAVADVIAALSSKVYIGVGIVLAAQVLVFVLIEMFRK